MFRKDREDPLELVELERLVQQAASVSDTRVLCTVDVGARRFPVYALAIGNPAPDAPSIGYFGGVHGLERIGAAVVLEFLRCVLERLRWDRMLQRQLEAMRMVFMPVVNPGGLWRGSRSNPQGIDLMRNAPIDATGRVPFLAGGHRLSPRLPWFRGPDGGPMQAECVALCSLVQEELLTHRFSIAVDCHSGFGLRDRIWFPFAYSRAPIPHLPEMHALARVLDVTHRHHRYVFEPQSRQYLTHGDLWDHLYLRACQSSSITHLPLTLEMGSWTWVKKNPRQIFSLLGLFNPLLEHRQARVLRRHLAWLDFITRATCSHDTWCPTEAERERNRQLGMARWFPAPRQR
jgi:hypothetical protein